MNINNSLNFKGYKNFIGCNIDIPNRGLQCACMNVQLDNVGNNDLDNYKEIQKLLKQTDDSLSKDVVHCVYVKKGNEEHLFFNEIPLHTGNELRTLSKKLHKNDFAKIEKAHLMAYSLLADISRRIMRNDLVNHDKGITDTIKQSIEVFKQILGEQKLAFELLNECFFTPPNPGHVARKINTKIAKAILNYFK